MTPASQQALDGLRDLSTLKWHPSFIDETVWNAAFINRIFLVGLGWF